MLSVQQEITATESVEEVNLFVANANTNLSTGEGIMCFNEREICNAQKPEFH